MDTPKSKDLGTIDAIENGTAVDVTNMYKYDKWVTLVGSTSPAWNGTVQIQVSNDGTNWVQEGANVTGSALRQITSRTKYIRIIGSAYTAGTMVGTVFGLESYEA